MPTSRLCPPSRRRATAPAATPATVPAAAPAAAQPVAGAPATLPRHQQRPMPLRPQVRTPMASSLAAALCSPSTARANRGSAVFVRGMTAWIVLQGAPPLDAVKLKTAARQFSGRRGCVVEPTMSACCASPSGSRNRSARTAEGSNLKVDHRATGEVESPIAIGFARNQDDATHSSLSTLAARRDAPCDRDRPGSRRRTHACSRQRSAAR